MQECSKALAAYYFLHTLNLSLTRSCKIQIVDNIIENYRAVQIFSNFQPKCKKFLEHIAEKRCHDMQNRTYLIDMNNLDDLV